MSARLRGRRTRLLAAGAALALVAGAAPASADVRSTEDACPPGAVPEDGMADVPEGNVHEAAIDCVVWWQVARGTGPGTYTPSATVTRAQMASFLARTLTAAGMQLAATPPDAFGDDDGNAHEDNINKLAAAGIVGGTGGGNYSPAAVVTRAQMATFLVRSYERVTGEAIPVSGDAFGDDEGDTHEVNIDKAAAAGFTGGTAPGSYSPGAPVRRDAMASFLSRVLDALVEAGHGSPPDGEGPPAPPPPPGAPGGPPAPPGPPPGE